MVWVVSRWGTWNQWTHGKKKENKSNRNSHFYTQRFLTTVTKALVLALSNFSNPFILETDVSRIGIDVVLSQSQHPIAFFSKKLSPQMQKQSAYTREFMQSPRLKFRHYLL
ncbi:hypothetical protein V8G54_020669 [Vigna mungo]|uniref:Reverse transcriptase/retrotransposon-derived protein RNase H-like domain-containing protein n=1 Tax=Vigna mungo TaxID=3915 RepID=A0AAQ3RW44_VIGMU